MKPNNLEIVIDMPQLFRKAKPHDLKYLSITFKNKIFENTKTPKDSEWLFRNWLSYWLYALHGHTKILTVLKEKKIG